jgi:AcrR family transcriptional regulator
MSRAVLSKWYGALMSAPRTARARARAQLTEDIKASARSQLAEVGASALSLRAVARDLGMASSAVYRYFPSRDSLLTALIVDSFSAVGEAAEAAVATSAGQPFVDRWVQLAVAIRAWAVGHPHEHALVYGSPVPGYAAPRDTVDPAARVSLAGLQVVADGIASGEVAPGPSEELPAPLAADLARLRAESAPAIPEPVLARTLLAWTALFGAISYERFGHLHGVISDGDTWFAHEMRAAAHVLAGGEG